MQMQISDMMAHIQDDSVLILPDGTLDAGWLEQAVAAKLHPTPARRRHRTRLLILAAILSVLATSAAACLPQSRILFFPTENAAEQAASAGAAGGTAGYSAYGGDDYDEAGMLERANFLLETTGEDETLVALAQGTAADGWSRMRTVAFSLSGIAVQDSYYQADSLSALSRLWDTQLELTWLEQHYEAVPGTHLATLRSEAGGTEPFYVSVTGEYRNEQGAVFNLQYGFEEGRSPGEQYRAASGHCEYYETRDGVTVAIETARSRTGKALFWVTFDSGPVSLSLFGTQLELTEIRALVDSLSLSRIAIKDT